jgi:hypothetical protein
MVDTATNAVQCGTHGLQPETFVCQHVVAGLAVRKRVGFWWSTESPENPRPDAWCTECNERVKATDGEWVGESERHLKPKILCGECYDLAKSFHMGGDPWQ